MVAHSGQGRGGGHHRRLEGLEEVAILSHIPLE
jgi:hypothetical protein